jgi:hypothetical protein
VSTRCVPLEYARVPHESARDQLLLRRGAYRALLLQQLPQCVGLAARLPCMSVTVVVPDSYSVGSQSSIFSIIRDSCDEEQATCVTRSKPRVCVHVRASPFMCSCASVRASVCLSAALACCARPSAVRRSSDAASAAASAAARLRSASAAAARAERTSASRADAVASREAQRVAASVEAARSSPNA